MDLAVPHEAPELLGMAELSLRRLFLECAERSELALSFEGAYMCAAYYDASTHPVAIPRLESMAQAIRRDERPMSLVGAGWSTSARFAPSTR